MLFLPIANKTLLFRHSNIYKSVLGLYCILNIAVAAESIFLFISALLELSAIPLSYYCNGKVLYFMRSDLRSHAPSVIR